MSLPVYYAHIILGGPNLLDDSIQQNICIIQFNRNSCAYVQVFCNQQPPFLLVITLLSVLWTHNLFLTCTLRETGEVEGCIRATEKRREGVGTRNARSSQPPLLLSFLRVYFARFLQSVNLEAEVNRAGQWTNQTVKLSVYFCSLDRECTRGIGEDMLKKAYNIIENKQEDLVEVCHVMTGCVKFAG